MISNIQNNVECQKIAWGNPNAHNNVVVDIFSFFNKDKLVV